MSSDRFMFFQNFKQIADGLPDDMRLKFYDAICNYAFCGTESDDTVIKALVTAIKPSLEKHTGWGGARDGAGRPKRNQDEILKNQDIQDNQDEKLEKKEKSSFSSLLETETEIKENKPYGLSKKKNTIDWDFVRTRWNDIANRYSRPQIKTITAERKKHFEKRLEEYNGTIDKLFDDIEYRIATSLLLQGQKINQYGEKENTDWKGCHFDFLCQPQSFTRLLEGVYGDKALEKQYEIKRQMATLQGGENK